MGHELSSESSAPPQVSIVVSTYGPDCTNLDLLLNAFLVQAHYKTVPTIDGLRHLNCLHDRPADDIHWEMIVLNDGYEASKRDWVSRNQQRANLTLLEFPKVREYAGNADLGSQGHWGHPLRGHGIAAAKGRWTVLTNDDNYYMPSFLSRACQETRDPDVMMVCFGTVNNLWGYRHLWPVSFEVGRIDMGSAIVRTDVARQVGFPFRGMTGDFDYLDACRKAALERSGKIAMLEELLFVHN